jgi:hypothetical protein
MDVVALEPGDLILVKSRGRVYAAGRRLAGNAYDHVGVVVERGQTVNIDKPRTRLLPVDRLLRAGLEPLVLRPAWHSPEARAEFVRWIETLAGREYDVRRTLRLLASIVLKRFVRVSWPLHRPDARSPRWICTDAVLLGLERFGFAQNHELLARLPLDWNTLGCGTTNDFLVISERHPELLRRVVA